MKKLFFTTLFAAGLMLASCGSNKTEGEASVDSTAVDTVSTAPMDAEPTTTPTDTAVPMNDTLAPAP
ncbi:MAG: entericidin [Bacteroidota bacterium]